jgi:hypothetical protein
MTSPPRTVPQRPSPLTPRQRDALHLLGSGWRCQSCMMTPEPFHKLVWYAFWLNGQSQHVAGSTLRSLEDRALITWEPANVTLAYDGTTRPGYALRLTPLGQQQVAHDLTYTQE